MKLLLILYDCIIILCVPFYLASLALRRKLTKQVFERFKASDKQMELSVRGKEVIWLHAVSLGEVSTCKSLIKQLSVRYPKKIILITTITSTGRTLAQSLTGSNVVSFSMPFDLSFLITSFMNTINPKMLILMETELWPNLLYYTQKRAIPTFVLNARVSDRSFAKYQTFRWFVRRFTAGISMFCVQSQLDRDRCNAIGIPSEKITITGNMKFDAIEEFDSSQVQELARIRESIILDSGDFLIVAGSTHPKEEEYVLDAFIQLKKKFKNIRLLFAPRHLERLESIEALIVRRHLKSERVSRLSRAAKNSILLLDTIGKLRLVYSLANLVFVGGSLVPIGGHNILEPAFFSKPIIVGPYMHNFRQITREFLLHNALIQLQESTQLFSYMKDLIADEGMRIDLGAAGKSVVASNQGATFRNLSIMRECIV